MVKIITKEQKIAIAKAFGLEYATLCSVMDVESGGSGFDDATGRIKIQFEPVWFSRFLTKKKMTHTFSSTKKIVKGVSKIDKYVIKYKDKQIINGVEGQNSEYLAFNAAISIDKDSALLSTSFGLGQIMGFNYLAAGYKTVDEMVSAFQESEENQLIGMIRFIKSNQRQWEALLSKDFATFAHYYNGASYKMFNYDIRLSESYKKYKNEKI